MPSLRARERYRADVEREAERAQMKAECERLSAGWVVCDHDGAPVSREVRHDVVCATCGVASVMVMRGSGRLSKIEDVFLVFVSWEGYICE